MTAQALRVGNATEASGSGGTNTLALPNALDASHIGNALCITAIVTRTTTAPACTINVGTGMVSYAGPADKKANGTNFSSVFMFMVPILKGNETAPSLTIGGTFTATMEEITNVDAAAGIVANGLVVSSLNSADTLQSSLTTTVENCALWASAGGRGTSLATYAWSGGVATDVVASIPSGGVLHGTALGSVGPKGTYHPQLDYSGSSTNNIMSAMALKLREFAGWGTPI